MIKATTQKQMNLKTQIDYLPQPKQEMFHRSPANEVLYGGAAGPGKSHALRFEGLIWCLRIPGLQAYLFRRTYPELEKNHILPALMQFPKDVCTYKKGDKRWEFYNGSMLHLCHCQYEQDVILYQGAEIHLLLIDELTTFTEFIYDYLRARVRCTIPIPDKYKHKIPGIAAGTNPGGVGHGFAKRRWVDFAYPMEVKKAPEKEGGMTRQYIPGLLEDNKILMQNDPRYIHRLDALPEPYRSAYKDGNWEIYLGQAFIFTRKDHVIPPMPIPRNAHLYMTYYWGYGAPFSIGWWWVDADGRLLRFKEWYGAMSPGMGLRKADSEVAEQINAIEEQLCKEYDLPMHTETVTPNPDDPTHEFNVTLIKDIQRICGHDCFQKKPNFYKGGGQGPSTAEIFSRYKIHMSVGDSDRVIKIRAFRERINIPKDGSRPMLQIYEGCDNFMRTIPDLVMDEHKIEDIDTKGEDHCYDEACHICMYRPLAVQPDKRRLSSHDKRIEALKKGDMSSYVQYATTMQEMELRRFGYDPNEDFGETEQVEDWELKPTIL
jgi:hypothetical protein